MATEDTKKSWMVYGLGIVVVVLCVGAGWLHYAFGECAKSGGTWHGVYCASK